MKDFRKTSPHRSSCADRDARALSYFGNRMEPRQIRNFEDSYEHRGYHDGRFWRTYLFPDILLNWLYDVTWSR